MRRWFAVLLLALLPLQFSWAAVTAYCEHESEAQSQHLGHHEHSHAGSAGIDNGSQPAGQEGPAAPDVDCGHCHGSCCSMPALAGALVPPALSSRPVALVEGSVRTVAQNPPERPQWLRFA